MPKVKVFAEDPTGIKLVGVSRYIMTRSWLYDQIITWCHENNIRARTVNTEAYSQMIFNALLWRVDDEEQRVMFALRWS